jgi:hypothetical protein
MVRSRVRLRAMAAASAAALIGIVGLVAGGTAAGAGTPTTIACEATALTNAFETGGDYAYGANCTLSLSTEFTLHSGISLELYSGGHEVTFVGTDFGTPFWAGNGNRFATVAGNLSLYGITVKQFSVGGTTLDGIPGIPGAAGTNSSCPDCPPGNGTDRAGNGGEGGRGGDGRDAHGGAILIEGTGVVTLEASEFLEDSADGGRGGAGGAGGVGGLIQGQTPSGQQNTGPGGAAGDGGDGGNGGDAYGGAIENDGTLVVHGGLFKFDIAMGGTSEGGDGGEGGEGIKVGGAGGDGGTAGRTGSAYGGAIYNTGNLTLLGVDFTADDAGYTAISASGDGGRGGPVAEEVGEGGREPTGPGSPGGPGGEGAPPGAVGIVVGGDVYSTGAFSVAPGEFTNGGTDADVAVGGVGGNGGRSNCDIRPPGSGCTAADGAHGSPTGTPPIARGQTQGETFVPAPNEIPGGGGGGGGTGTGGGSGDGSGSGGSGTNGSGGSGSTGSGSGNPGTGGPGSGSSSSGHPGGGGNGSSGSGDGSGHATTGKLTSSGTTASLPAHCPASGPNCRLTGELIAAGVSNNSLPVTSGDRRLLKALVLGRATVTIRHGHSGTLKVKLGAGGRHLLAARHRLKARLVVTQRIGARKIVLHTGTVKFGLDD